MSGYLLGFSEHDGLHYVAAGRPDHGVCGARLSFVPLQQPASPFVHERCRDMLTAALAAGDEVAVPWRAVDGTCSHCGGSVDLDGAGLAVAHNKVIMRGGRMVVSSEACTGAGETPEDEL